MKRKTIQKVRVEEASVSEDFDRLFLWCRTLKGYVETSIPFDKHAPKHSYLFQQWRLVQHLLACHDVDEEIFWRRGSHALRGKHFLFELLEIKPRVWKINKAKATEPIDFEALEAQAIANLDDLLAERCLA